LKQKIAKFIKPELVGMERDNFVEKVVDLERDLADIKSEMTKILSKSSKFWKEF
jgi:predicted transcriptional regulator